MAKKVAVIIVAHGEAETDGFLDNFSMTRHTLAHASEVMKLPRPLQLLISIMSGLKNRARFAKLRYVSPHNQVTRKQVARIADKLARYRDASGSLSFDVFPAFSVTVPFMEDVIDDTRHYDAQIMLYMSPVDNRLACGSICWFLNDKCGEYDLSGVKIVSRLWRDKGLLAVYLDHIFQHAEQTWKRERDEPVLVLCFHGTLIADAQGNPPLFHTGQQETTVFGETLRALIMKDTRNPFRDVYSAYLNHDVGGTWTSPSLEETLEMLKKEPPRPVALFNAGYFAEGNETILNAMNMLKGSGLSATTYIPCINDAEIFTEFLADRIVSAAEQVIGLKFS